MKETSAVLKHRLLRKIYFNEKFRIISDYHFLNNHDFLFSAAFRHSFMLFPSHSKYNTGLQGDLSSLLN